MTLMGVMRAMAMRATMKAFLSLLGAQRTTNKSPVDFLRLLITDEILLMIVEQTNVFAEQYTQSHELSRRSRIRQWSRSPHDLEELNRFLAIIHVMGIVDHPCVEDAWVTSWPFANPTFSSIMSRDRFSLILRFLHLNDSSKYVPKGQPGHDPLYKLHPLLDPPSPTSSPLTPWGVRSPLTNPWWGSKVACGSCSTCPKSPPSGA